MSIYHHSARGGSDRFLPVRAPVIVFRFPVRGVYPDLRNRGWSWRVAEKTMLDFRAAALFFAFTLGFWTLGCPVPGQLLIFDDDDDASGADDDDDIADDDTGDDDTADDDDTGDDDTGDDDTGDDDTVGDDDTGDDDTGDDDDTADDDDDSVPMVDCGPYVAPNQMGELRAYAGAGALQITQNWHWVGCEVERRFDDGQLECEILWDVAGDYYDWDENSMTALYELEFAVDEDASTCPLEPDHHHQQWYYSAEFDWDHGLMHLAYSQSPWNNFQSWASAEITEQGATAPFQYRTDFFQ